MPTGRDKLVVRPQLGDPTGLDDGDAVGIVSRVQSVRDGDDGAPRQNRGQMPLQVAGGTRIKQGCRLVENENVRVCQYQASQRDLLCCAD